LLQIGRTIREFEGAKVRRAIVLCLCDYLVYERSDDLEIDEDQHDKLSSLMDAIAQDVDLGRSEISEMLVNMILDATEDLEIRRTCTIGLATVGPEHCLACLALLFTQISTDSCEVVARALEPGYERAVDKICEHYYGDLCPGYLNALEEPETRLNEYERVIDTWRPAIAMFGFSQSSYRLEKLLRNLDPEHKTVPDHRNQGRLFK
jgi:hypothetical protein